MEHSFRAWAESGLCEEAAWPYDELGRTRVDRDPPEHCHITARHSRPIPRPLRAPDGAGLLDLARRSIALGIPVGVEIRLCPSISMSLLNGGVIPVQLPTEQSVGPHVVLLTGYDDEADTAPYDRGTGSGAFRVRNSWGAGWGVQGYGLLPYPSSNSNSLARTGLSWKRTDRNSECGSSGKLSFRPASTKESSQ
ncbi:C1 family peptidase [Streptomyces sp. NPDC007205]|uniref:C1 family peptidase n=1 Tax=Streptomyces sp. NPDC007205 TaxID=3154316 RepID=UPI0033DDAD82